MTKDIFKISLFCVLLAFPLKSEGKEAENWTEAELAKLKENFARLDKDKNQWISIQEMAKLEEEKFNAIDANKDGLLTISEFMGYRAPGANRYLTSANYSLRKSSFYRMDFDLDKKLSLEEFYFSVNKKFFSVDRNNDGKITFEEFSRLPLTRRSSPTGN